MKLIKISECQLIWHKLFESAKNATPFLSYEWFSCLAQNILRQDPEIIVFEKNSKPVALLPAKLHKNTIQFITDQRLTDYCDILCQSGYEEFTIKQLVSLINQKKLQLTLSPLKEESILYQLLPNMIQRIEIKKIELCPMLKLPTNWDEYLSSLNSKSRHELRRKLRRASIMQINHYTTDDLYILFELMANSSRAKKLFLSEEIKKFFSALALRFEEKGWLRFKVGIINKQPAAVIFAFQYNKKIYLYNSGFDHNFAQFSPGIVLIANDLKDAIAHRITEYDFLRGAEDYKFKLGATTYYTYHLKT